MPLPFLTADQPGIGGLLRESPEDFEVEELPAYLPSGAGDHIFAFVEKRDLTTPFAVIQLARALGVSPRDVGTAGMKDRRAVTRQWVSLPPPVTADRVRVLAAENSIAGLRILEVAPHQNKLRTGHLRGNRFTLVVRRALPGAADRARQILAALAAAPGAPNWYGEQRFGRAGDNAAAGLALVRKERRFERDPRKNRLLLSALQSELFNRWLERRIHDGLYRAVLEGDLLRKAAGGIFASTEPAVDQARLLAGEVLPTGPMFGVEMRGPVPQSPAALREDEILAAAGISLAELAHVKKLAPGARRDAAIAIADWSVEAEASGAATDATTGETVVVRFTLPAGAYATAVMRELQKLAPGERAESDRDGDADAEPGEESDAEGDRAGNTSTPSLSEPLAARLDRADAATVD